MNKIIKLAKILSGLGHHAESYSLLKIATPPPLEGVVPLDKWEQPDFGPTEDDEGNTVERTFDRIKRNKKILRDRRERDRLKHKMERSPIPIEEEEASELGEWYNAIKEVGDSVILIPFDRQDLDNNDDALIGLGSVFGFHPKNYKDFYEKANMLQGRYKQGNVDTLKSVFPSLWADISTVLSEKGLSESDVVFMLYNQENGPVERFAGFTKDPFYFGHDLGHNVFDSEDNDWEFKAILNEFISGMYQLYMSEADEEEGEESVSAYTEIEDEEEDKIMAAISNFFHNPSGPDDSYGDVFAAAASGNINVRIPNAILNLEGSYYLPSENITKAEALKDKVIEKLKLYMNSNHQYGTMGSGPLSYFAGSVVLNDI